MNPDPVFPKTYEIYGTGLGSGSATLEGPHSEQGQDLTWAKRSGIPILLDPDPYTISLVV